MNTINVVSNLAFFGLLTSGIVGLHAQSTSETKNSETPIRVGNVSYYPLKSSQPTSVTVAPPKERTEMITYVSLSGKASQIPVSKREKSTQSMFRLDRETATPYLPVQTPTVSAWISDISNHTITVKIEGFEHGSSAIAKVSVTDQTGRTVQSLSPANGTQMFAGSAMVSQQLNNASAGCYFVVVKSGTISKVVSLVLTP